MRETRATLEVIAPTVEEAIEKGLADLGLPADAVDVEVLDQGSKGLFRIGSRQARVRLIVKNSGMTDQDMPVVSTAVDGVESAPVEVVETTSGWPTAQAVEQPVEEAEAAQPAAPLAAAEGEGEDDLRVARDTVTELLEKMKVRADVTSRYGETDKDSTRTPIHVDVMGDDLSILIGRRAETLNALQYISSLIVSKELGRTISLVVDVEGYRSRRENQLRGLARRMAEQAIKTGRRQVLEPMPASERRIVHMELRDNPDVKTESIGEEPRRKVTIVPKE